VFDSTLEIRERLAEAPPGVLDALVVPGDVAVHYAGAQPGADAVAALAAVDPRSLTVSDRIDLLIALDRQAAWLAALQHKALAGLTPQAVASAPAESELERDPDWIADQVACALRLSARTAADKLRIADTLHEMLPGTRKLLGEGLITALQATAVADAVIGGSVDADGAAEVERRILGRAPEQTLSELKRAVRRAVLAAAPATAAEQHAAAMQERRVCVTPVDHGMAELWAYLPAEGAAAVMSAVNALACVTSADDPRGIDARRADVLVDLAVGALHDPRLPREQGTRPAVQVTVALSTLLGLDEQPGELAGYGPITAEVARRIAADPTGTWRRLVVDPMRDRLVDCDRRTYRPPADLAAFVIARDQVCSFPGCNIPARRCDLDHRVPYESGGATCEHNLQPLCRHHYRLKHEGGWTVRRNDDGSYAWTTPTGHVYRARPPSYPGYHDVHAVAGRHRKEREADLDPDGDPDGDSESRADPAPDADPATDTDAAPDANGVTGPDDEPRS
jgi:hypothetical protein